MMNTTACGMAAKSQTIGEKEPIEPPAIMDVHNTFSEARDLAYRVMALVDRIVGPAPSQDAKGAPVAEPTAVFDIMRHDSRRTVWTVRDAQEALNRLERALP